MAWLEFGLAGPLHIREERLTTQADACRLLYISDLHLRPGRSSMLCQQILAAATGTGAHVVLLGGDLVDRVTELEHLQRLVGALGGIAPVLAIGGNHDQQLGLHRVREAVERGGGRWIHADETRVLHGSRSVLISGPEAVTGSEPVATWPDEVRILCAHNPRIWRTARDRGYNLVLAGHLHGCQVVAFEFRDRLFPGAVFYPYCYLSHQSGATRLVVSRGVSDFVPVRWRCPRELVLCHV